MANVFATVILPLAVNIVAGIISVYIVRLIDKIIINKNDRHSAKSGRQCVNYLTLQYMGLTV